MQTAKIRMALTKGERAARDHAEKNSRLGLPATPADARHLANYRRKMHLWQYGKAAIGAAAIGVTAILAAFAMAKFADEQYNAAGQKARADFEKTRSDQLAMEDAARAEKIAAEAAADDIEFKFRRCLGYRPLP
jgi:hypothetical protein